jgi:prepilin-type N-terminal cleavage/methylation domain-containing protein
VRPMERRQGFTLIEIMIAVAIMTVGAVGIMALQQAATRGNLEARDMSMGTHLTRTWIERLRRDAVLWLGNGVPINTQYLVLAPPLGGGPGPWVTPPLVPRPDGTVESFAFDHFGIDTANLTNDPGGGPPGPAVYCTHLSFTWINPGDALRADVRTYWHRRNPAQRYPCTPGNAAAINNVLQANQGGDIRAVFASTIIRRGGS